MDGIGFAIAKIGSGEASERRILSTDLSTASSVGTGGTELGEEGRWGKGMPSYARKEPDPGRARKQTPAMHCYTTRDGHAPHLS
jgi:hypothetical protein